MKKATKKRKAKKEFSNKWSEIKILAWITLVVVVGLFAIHPSLFALFHQRAVSGLGSSKQVNEVKGISYKPSLLGGEIPSHWNQVFLGDVGPAPLPKENYLDSKYVVYSFASRAVSFGDINWEQVDVYQMESKDLVALVDKWKVDPEFNQYTTGWTKETIDGREIDVVTFKTEDDGSVTKGGAGGKMYFIPTEPDMDYNPSALIISKQARGEQSFEDGFTRFIQGLDIDQLPNITFTP